MKVVDLSVNIDEDTPVFPGDPHPSITQIASIEKDGWNEKRLCFNSHFSTHIDAPFHMLTDGKRLDEFSIEFFFGEAIVIDARERDRIDLSGIKENDFVFLYTGSLDGNITVEIAQQLIDKGVKIIGVDSLSPDKEPFEVHKMLFRKEILIVECLANLDKLIGRRFECVILPLKIKNADGAPCRVVARLND